jgi:hypothetical protein
MNSKPFLSDDESKQLSTDQVLEALGTTAEGLSSNEASHRLPETEKKGTGLFFTQLSTCL